MPLAADPLGRTAAAYAAVERGWLASPSVITPAERRPNRPDVHGSEAEAAMRTLDRLRPSRSFIRPLAIDKSVRPCVNADRSVLTPTAGA